MEIQIGKRIHLKREFIDKFEPNEKASTSFQVIALTDVAVGVTNTRNGRTYTLSLNAVSNNMTPSPASAVPRGKVVARPVTPPPVVPPLPITDPVVPPPVEIFTHDAPTPMGTLRVRADALTSVEASSDDPFGGLYG